MKVVIDIPGVVNHGLESPERGESRWAQNWAKFLAEEGHEVICVCSGFYSWGEARPVNGCKFIKFSSTEKIVCDIFMHAAWWPGRDIGNIEAKTYVHLNYCFEQHLKDPGFIQNKHVLAFPYLQSKQFFINDENPFAYKTFCLPVPLAEEFSEPAFSKAELTYSAKDVFLSRHSANNRHWYEAGKNVISAIAAVSREMGMKCNFLIAEQLVKSPDISVAEYNIMDIIKSSHSYKMYLTSRLGVVYDILSRSKMVFPVISPGGSMLEAVVRGVVPLTWSGSLFDEEAESLGVLLRHDSSYERIYSVIRRILTDETLYNELSSLYQKALSPHLYKNSREYFSNLEGFSEC